MKKITLLATILLNRAIIPQREPLPARDISQLSATFDTENPERVVRAGSRSFVMDYDEEMKTMMAEFDKLEQEKKELEKKEKLEETESNHFNPSNAKKKKHLKMSSAEVVYCK